MWSIRRTACRCRRWCVPARRSHRADMVGGIPRPPHRPLALTTSSSNSCGGWAKGDEAVAVADARWSRPPHTTKSASPATCRCSSHRSAADPRRDRARAPRQRDPGRLAHRCAHIAVDMDAGRSGSWQYRSSRCSRSASGPRNRRPDPLAHAGDASERYHDLTRRWGAVGERLRGAGHGGGDPQTDTADLANLAGGSTERTFDDVKEPGAVRTVSLEPDLEPARVAEDVRADSTA